MNYKTLMKKAFVHKGRDGVASCSQLSPLLSCGAWQNRPAGKAALKGTVLHYCMEHDLIPEGIPQDELEKLKWLRARMEDLKRKGWMIIDTEQYIETDYLTGSYDVLMKRNDIYLIIDYKTGLWPVDDADNIQMGGYIHLSYQTMDKTTIIHSMILQPSKGTMKEMSDWPYDRALKLGEDIQNINRTKKIGSMSACEWCADRECEERV